MASGAQQQHHHQQQHQSQQPPPSSQQQHEHLMQQQQQQQQTNQQQQMQFAPQQQNHPASLRSNSFDHQQQQQVHHNAMSPVMTSIPINHVVSMNPHQQQQQQSQMMRPVVGSPIMNQVPCNQTSSHIQQPQQQQKSQILPLLLSPRPPSLKSTNSIDRQTEQQSENDHDQIIDQVISLENDYSDTTAMLTNVDDSTNIMMGHQQQPQQQDRRSQQHHQHLMGDINLGSGICIADSNQLSSSSEDLLNLLLEFDREPSNLIGLDNDQQDEKMGIENIRKQLMSCEVQSDQNQQQNANSMSTIVNQMTCQPQQQQNVAQQQQLHNSNTTNTTNSGSSNVHQQQQLVSQLSPVISHHQQSHQIPTSGPSQITTDQTMLHSGTYSNISMSPVPVSSSGQPFANQHQHVNRISQSNPMSIVSNSPSPSWQQPQLSPYSPQTPHNSSRTPTQKQGQHSVHPMQHQTTTSPQMQQIHNNPLQTRSPNQSVSPPATTEPSPVVKKNPLLNAQLINSRAPSITPTRFMNNQTSVLNQNPILNAKLSQSPFVTNSSGSPVNPSLNSQSRFIQQNQQQNTNFNFDMNQQQQQQQQQTAQQQGGHISLYGHNDQQQQSTNQIFRTNTTTATGSNAGSVGTPVTMGNTSPSGGSLSQQVKQEIRRKVSQPKQHQQTTSLLKQLLSDDNK